MFEAQHRKKKKKMPRQITREAKRFLLISDVAKGMTYMDIVYKYMEEWGLGLKTVVAYLDDAVAHMKSEATKETIIAMNMQRLDNLISESIKDKDRKNAIRAIDTQNKLAGGYEEKVKIDTEGEINLIFDI